MWRAARSMLVVALAAAVGVRSPAGAQPSPERVRLVVATAAGEERWTGALVEATPDTLRLRVTGSDSLAAVPRSAVRSLERWQPVIGQGRAAAVGCLVVGGLPGAVALSGHDPDSPGIERSYAKFGAVVGCGLGALGGLIVSYHSRHVWRPWTPPARLRARDVVAAGSPENTATSATVATAWEAAPMCDPMVPFRVLAPAPSR